MKRLTWLNATILGALLVFVISCGTKKETDNTDYDHLVDVIQAENLEQARSMARAGETRCVAEGCDGPVAMLTAASADGVSSCTAFLLAPDLMATNSHCIPLDLKAPGSNCSDRIWVTFSREDRSAPFERHECSEIIEASDIENGVRKDYAFLRLKTPSNREPLRISRAGFQAKDQISIWKMTPDHSRHEVVTSIFSKKKCQVIMSSLLLPDFDNPKREVVSIADCELRHGNSGSPILSATGEVLGIAQATTELTRVRSIDLKERKLVLPNTKQVQIEIATNFACFTPPGIDLPPETSPESCHSPFTEKFRSLTPHEQDRVLFQTVALPSLQKEIKPRFMQWKDSLSGLPSELDWNLSNAKLRDEKEKSLLALSIDEQAAYPVPVCIKSSSASKQPGKELLPTKAYFSPKLWRYRFAYDSYMRPAYLLRETQGGQGLLREEAGAVFSVSLPTQQSGALEKWREFNLSACNSATAD